MQTNRASKFSALARAIAQASGHPAAFFIAVLLVLAWAAMGPLVGYSDTWQLAINTATTIATFLMVFLVQNTQNRDSVAMQLKLDELLRALKGAHLALLDLEELDQDELERIRANYERIAREARQAMRSGGSDTGSPDVRPEVMDRLNDVAS